MSLLDTLLMLASMVGLAALPSSSVALVVTRAATGGFSHGAAVAAGIVVGDLVFVCLAVLGLAALAEILGGFFVVVRYLAGFVLICLGLSLLLGRNTANNEVQPAGTASYMLSFLSGLAITLGDIKAIVFYASFLPAFVHLHALTLTDLSLVALITILGVGSVKLGYAWTASRMSVHETLGPTKGIRLCAGGILAGAGAWLIAKP